ncbi:hypothetical protein PVL29_024969 [Vitis rotundifolia]|uniref:Terpene synthase metal-binding domain-containing protein n=1 Tax=Vitis rotundifolia TaxID=103349 RepID=A0AA38YTA9_VITRO|nr:hypothetical protein PVL29_024969 [Vitis rotundifolia]
MQVARVSSALPLATTLSFIGIGEMITKEAFDWVYNDLFTVASCLIARLMNNMTVHKEYYEQMKANSSFFHIFRNGKGIICIDVILLGVFYFE